MSIRKVKMATAILIVFNMPERGHSNGVFEKQPFLHSQKLRTVVGQKYHPEWYFLTRPARTIFLLVYLCIRAINKITRHRLKIQKTPSKKNVPKGSFVYLRVFVLESKKSQPYRHSFRHRQKSSSIEG